MNDFNITVFEKRKMLNQFYQKCQQAESAETAHWLKDSEDSNPVYLDTFNLKKEVVWVAKRERSKYWNCLYYKYWNHIIKGDFRFAFSALT